MDLLMPPQTIQAIWLPFLGTAIAVHANVGRLESANVDPK
jgi:hypothetical protein